MPRKPRFNLPGLPQHVIQRGNNREPCFYSTADYQYYLTCLDEALLRFQCRLHSYVLMTNHVHMLVTPDTDHGISFMMQAIGRKYVQHINHTYQRSGTLWEGRYKAGVIDSEAWLLTCMRYIEMNPVRAGMVSHPGEYRWSSYAANALGREATLLSPHVVLKSLGATCAERRHAYRELFGCDIDVASIHEIRETVNQELVLGREDFKDMIARMTRRQVRRGKDGRPPHGSAED